MKQLSSARGYFRSAPSKALGDVFGLIGLCMMIYAGFAAPAFF